MCIVDFNEWCFQTEPPTPDKIYKKLSLSPEHLKDIEVVVTKQKERAVSIGDASSLPMPSDGTTHRSPFHRAKKHFKNIMGGELYHSRECTCILSMEFRARN